jgi:hypothetical protein
MLLALERRLDHRGAMPRKSEPIDDLIDAHVWMWRQDVPRRAPMWREAGSALTIG